MIKKRERNSTKIYREEFMEKLYTLLKKFFLSVPLSIKKTMLSLTSAKLFVEFKALL